MDQQLRLCLSTPMMKTVKNGLLLPPPTFTPPMSPSFLLPMTTVRPLKLTATIQHQGQPRLQLLVKVDKEDPATPEPEPEMDPDQGQALAPLTVMMTRMMTSTMKTMMNALTFLLVTHHREVHRLLEGLHLRAHQMTRIANLATKITIAAMMMTTVWSATTRKMTMRYVKPMTRRRMTRRMNAIRVRRMSPQQPQRTSLSLQHLRSMMLKFHRRPHRHPRRRQLLNQTLAVNWQFPRRCSYSRL